ncbi:hypothetical protein YC2023_006196 [Brassica napus]
MESGEGLFGNIRGIMQGDVAVARPSRQWSGLNAQLFIDIEKESLFRLSITTMAHSFTFLADQKVGRCSNNEEVRLLTCWEICNIYRV